MPEAESGIRVYSGMEAASRLSDEHLGRTIRRLVDEIWDDPRRTMIPGTQAPLTDKYPELDDVLTRETFVQLTEDVQRRIERALLSGFLPWTWDHSFHVTMKDAKELRDKGQYTVVTHNDTLAGAVAYKKEGTLENGEDVYSPTKAYVFEEFRSSPITVLMHNAVFRQVLQNCGPHEICVLSKNPRVLNHAQRRMKGHPISLEEHQDIRARGGLVRYPEAILELCRANNWQAWLGKNPMEERERS